MVSSVCARLARSRCGCWGVRAVSLLAALASPGEANAHSVAAAVAGPVWCIYPPWPLGSLGAGGGAADDSVDGIDRLRSSRNEASGGGANGGETSGDATSGADVESAAIRAEADSTAPDDAAEQRMAADAADANTVPLATETLLPAIRIVTEHSTPASFSSRALVRPRLMLALVQGQSLIATGRSA